MNGTNNINFTTTVFEPGYSAFEMWWHTRRNQISSFAETDGSI